MKKLFLLAITSFAVSISSQAQYKQGDFLLNVGIGAGYHYAGGVPLMVSGEYSFTDKLGIGPYLAWTSWGYSNYYHYSFVDTGIRASYHFSEALGITEKKLDIYGGGILGYRFTSYSYDGPGNPFYRDSYDDALVVGVNAGARWNFTSKFGAYGELGYGISILKLGVTFNF